MRILNLLIFGVLAACNSNPPAEAKVEPVATDVLFHLPGDYAQKTTLADFESRFGAANVVRKTAAHPGVILFPDDLPRRAFVTFHKPAELQEVARITVSDANSRWRGKHGVHVGMNFARLRELNGKPFLLSGFDAKQRARVSEGWSPATAEDASLGAFDVAEGDHLYFEVELGVIDSSQVKLPLPADFQLSSDDPRMRDFKNLLQVISISASSSLDDEWE